MASVNIGIPEKNRKQIATHLNELLSNEYVLYTKTLKYHWNIVGKWFGPLHALFKEQYEALLTIADDIAERVRALGFQAFGTLAEFAEHTTLKEHPGKYPHDTGMIKDLLDDHEIIIKQIRADIPFMTEQQDDGTSNFLQDLIVKHEKMAWMLRAHLEK
jgi:starvation-inducible DNA-binding protein